MDVSNGLTLASPLKLETIKEKGYRDLKYFCLTTDSNAVEKRSRSKELNINPKKKIYISPEEIIVQTFTKKCDFGGVLSILLFFTAFTHT
jgi:hypothetical protein